MEHELTAAQSAAYDYRRCDRIWQRVDPALTPYPAARAAMAAETAASNVTGVEQDAELTLPGAEADPCCMGSAALDSVDVLQGFVREELADRRSSLLLARRAPSERVRRLLSAIASDDGQHARRLNAAVFLITGECYTPSVCYPPQQSMRFCAALRRRYHEEACGGFNYRRAAQEALDPCLQQLLFEFSEEKYRHARLLLDLLAASL